MTGGSGDLRAALQLLASLWTLLLLGALAGRWIGADAARLGAFAAAGLLGVLAAPRVRPRRWRRRLGCLLAGLAVGFAALPWLVAATGALGLVLGLPAARSPAAPGWGDALAALLWAPLFEESIYRGRLLPALARRLGAAAAVVISSALFALPHVEGWSLLGTFLAGLLLGTVWQLGRSLPLCVGLHAGLNLAALVCGLPPARWSLPPLVAFAASALGLWMALGLAGAFHTSCGSFDSEPGRDRP